LQLWGPRLPGTSDCKVGSAAPPDGQLGAQIRSADDDGNMGRLILSWGWTCASGGNEKGIRISNDQMRQLAIEGDAFHPEWNYTIKPRNPKQS